MTKEATGADFKSATELETKKLFIETYGCQMNVADSEVIASIMQWQDTVRAKASMKLMPYL